MDESRKQFEEHLATMPEWDPQFEMHRAWVETYAWHIWQAARSLTERSEPEQFTEALPPLPERMTVLRGALKGEWFREAQMRKYAHQAIEASRSRDEYRDREWISVDDEVPAYSVKVLICRASGGPPHERTIGYRRTNATPEWRYTDGETCWNVTHWRPIPPPPLASSPSGKPGGEG